MFAFDPKRYLELWPAEEEPEFDEDEIVEVTPQTEADVEYMLQQLRDHGAIPD